MHTLYLGCTYNMHAESRVSIISVLPTLTHAFQHYKCLWDTIIFLSYTAKDIEEVGCQGENHRLLNLGDKS